MDPILLDPITGKNSKLSSKLSVSNSADFILFCYFSLNQAFFSKPLSKKLFTKIFPLIKHFNPQKSHFFITHQDVDGFISLLIQHVLKLQPCFCKNSFLPLSHQYPQVPESNLFTTPVLLLGTWIWVGKYYWGGKKTRSHLLDYFKFVRTIIKWKLC